MKKRPDETTELYNAVEKYLSKQGWKVVVIGGTGVRQLPGALEMNYEFVVKFTGVRRNSVKKRAKQ